MRVGLDFDNTIVLYERVFHALAVAEHGMPPDVPATKKAVRDWFWSQPDGNTPWTALQGLVYGLRLDQADLAPGLPEFLRRCRERGVPVGIVSHKTEWPALGPRVNLRQAAWGLLEARGFFAKDGFGLAREHVFFEGTRAEKVARIRSEGCTVFVDDLPEVFLDPGFPEGVERILYERGGVLGGGRGGSASAPPSESRAAFPPPGESHIRAFADWAAIEAHLLGPRP